MSYFGAKLFIATCFNIYISTAIQIRIQNDFFIAHQKEVKKMMEEQKKEIIHTILNKIE